MTSTVLTGSTGLVGGNILTLLSSHPSVSLLHAYSRRELPTSSSSSKVTPLVSADTSKWPSLYPQASSLLISALGSTRGGAGSLENQRKIDYDLNLALAKAAKEAGSTTYVLISSGAANSKSYFPYLKMKGELEDAVKELGFEHTVILRPGLLIGSRQDSRPPEFALQKIASLAGRISSSWLKDTWAQDADVVAKAAVTAGLMCVEGKVPAKVWEVTQAEIIKLGKTEWKDF